jgi:hypothetical protein
LAIANVPPAIVCRIFQNNPAFLVEAIIDSRDVAHTAMAFWSLYHGIRTEPTLLSLVAFCFEDSLLAAWVCATSVKTPFLRFRRLMMLHFNEFKTPAL